MTKLCKDCAYHVKSHTYTCKRTEKFVWIDRVSGNDILEQASCCDERSFWKGVFGGCGPRARYFKLKDK